MARVRVRIGGRTVWVTRPNGREYGHLAIEILLAMAQARADGGDVFIVPPPNPVNPALLDLRSADVRHLEPYAPLRAWLTSRWHLADWIERSRERGEQVSHEAWIEVARELTRHVGDPRLPRSVRERVRGIRQRVLDDVEGDADTGSAALYYRRRLIRDPVRVDFRAEMRDAIESAGAEVGIERGARIVTIHTREAGWKRGREVQELKSGRRDDSARNARIETYFDAVDELVADGYRVIRVGDPSMVPLVRRGVIDLATHPRRTPAMEVLALLRSEFLMCGDAGPHAVSYLTNTPCLVVNVSDPICSFPVRRSGMFIFKKVVDLDTGRLLDLPEMMGEAHYRNLRNTGVFGYRDNTSDEIAMAAREMKAALAADAPETDAQRRYRALATEAGLHLRTRVRYVRKWGPDDGFLGDGRVADFYARRYLQ